MPDWPRSLPGARWRALAAAGAAAFAGGGYWYLRNLVHTGNPLPWIHNLGPISLPAPRQGLGGREAHSVLGYLTDGSVWSDWFLPGLHNGFWILWPLLGAAALAGLLLSLVADRRRDRRSESAPGGEESGSSGSENPAAGTVSVLGVAGLVGLATALAWLLAPTSASGPAGMPRGFESGLRYLAPALALGLALLPASPPLRSRAVRLASSMPRLLPGPGKKFDVTAAGRGRRSGLGVGLALVLLAVVIGYPVQRHYLENRYANPSFAAPGRNAAVKWSRGVSGARIATTSTRHAPLFGTDLSNRVQFVGVERPHGGFEAPATCRQWRRLLNEGHYDYVLTSRDRLEPGKPHYPPTTRWTEGPGAEVILRKPPTVVFRLTAPLNPASCPR
ncbi:MAG: hypothetical protein U0R26_04035 [Solirubrobacterales bacterium]